MGTLIAVKRLRKRNIHPKFYLSCRFPDAARDARSDRLCSRDSSAQLVATRERRKRLQLVLLLGPLRLKRG